MLKKSLAAIGLLLVVALPFGCAQNDPDAPTPGGPSTGLVITKVTAIPDVIPADNITESTLRLEARTRDGNPLPGRDVVFYIIDVQTPGIPGLEEIEIRFCSQLSSIGSIVVGTDTTDANGVAWGVFRAGGGAVYGEIRDDVDVNDDDPHDECDCSDTRTILHQPGAMWTIVMGKLTDPRETEGNAEIQDTVRIEQYGGSIAGC